MAISPLQTPRAGAKAADRKRGSIVDVKRQLSEALAREGKTLEIVTAHLTGTQRLGADLGLLGKDTRCELVGAHFEAEESRGRAVIEFAAIALPFEMLLGAIKRDVHGERGLAHARTPGEDDQVGIVEARSLLVDHVEPGGLARQAPARIHRGFGHLDRGERGIAEARCFVAGCSALGNLEEIGLGLTDPVHRIGLFRGVECAFDETAPHADQFTQKRKVIDLLGQFARGEEPSAVRGQLCQVFRTAKFLERLVRLEIRTQRHRRGGRIALDQGEYAFIDARMERFEEMVGPDRGLQFLDHAVVDQHRAEERSLGFKVGGQLAPTI